MIFVLSYGKERELAEKMWEIEKKEEEILQREACLDVKEKSLEMKEEEVVKAAAADEDCDNYPFLTSSIRYWDYGDCRTHFNVNPAHKSPKWFRSEETGLLWRHNYYKGWLDCMKSFDDSNACLIQQVTEEEFQYVWNGADGRNAIRLEHPLRRAPRSSTRRPARQPIVFFHKLTPQIARNDLRFWNAVVRGQDHAKECFWKCWKDEG